MPRTRARRLRSPAGLLLGLVAVSVAGRAVAGLHVNGLWVVPDEMIWASLGRSLWEDGELRVLGGPTRLFGVVYPAFAGAPLVLAGVESGYDALKVLQALVMSLTAVPVYLWARRLAGAGWALVAAALSLVLPGLVFAGLVMSEVVFLPVLVLAAWAAAAALERPTPGRQALLVGAILLAAATRLQALVLLPALLLALALLAALERDLRRPARLWPAVAALVALGAGWTVYRWAVAGSATAALGGYRTITEASFGAADVARQTLYHSGALLLLVGLYPVCALALLLVRALRARDEDPALRAYLATATAFAAALLLQVGAFTSVYVSGGIADRYLLPLAPILFVGFAAWLGRGAPRPRATTALVALAALGVLLAQPLRDLVVQPAAWQSPTVIPLIWLREHVADGTFELVVWGAAAGALGLFALVARRAVALLPALAALFLAFGSAAASREVVQNVAFDQRFLVGGEPRWIDEAARGSVGYVFVGERPVNILWHQLYWNERLDVVYVPRELGAAGLPVEVPVTIRGDGALVRTDGREVNVAYVVAVDGVTFAGAPAAHVEIEAEDQTGLTLWRVPGVPRVQTLRAGIRKEGDMHGPARVDVWDCSQGQLELTLLPKSATRVDLRVNGQVQRQLTFRGEAFVNATVFPEPGADFCRFEIVPDALLGSTRIEFLRRAD